VKQVSDGEFQDEVLQSGVPVLVDFWAPWCGPCLMVGPIVEELAKEYADKVKFCKMNVDDNPMTPGDLGIHAIPTLILFKDGREADRIVGAVPRARLEEAIKKTI